MNKRFSGILMPISSLPSRGGIGTLGQEAFDFIDFLGETNQTYWQILPLGPTSYGDSPYQTYSIYAGNPYFIDLELLKETGYLTEDELPARDESSLIDYESLYHQRFSLLDKAFQRFSDDKALQEFQREEPWVLDYALFMALKTKHQAAPWYQWDEKYKYYKTLDIETFYRHHRREVHYWIFLQLIFRDQWQRVRDYAHDKGIEIIGDIPLYVSYDSVEVWTQPELFQLKENLEPISVAGYPPDAFSEAGQLWGNPLYDWPVHAEENFDWWRRRLLHQQRLYDHIRLDHFIGFSNYWAIPYGDVDATRGEWKEGPGEHFFEVINREHPELQLIAEDLGNVTEKVAALREFAGLPSMRVLQFGFDPHGDSDALPHHYGLEIIAYTGTHDNETIMGWWSHLEDEVKAFAREYLHIGDDTVVEAMMRALWSSSAKTVITTVQDLLYLDNTYRINTPNSLGNWTFRVENDYLEKIDKNFLSQLTSTYRRTP